MSKKFQVQCPVEYEQNGERKTYWIKLGNAFVNQNGNIIIHLNALPINGKLVLSEPKDFKGEGKSNYNKGGGKYSRSGNSQDVPF
jgi:hypothetical protein